MANRIDERKKFECRAILRNNKSYSNPISTVYCSNRPRTINLLCNKKPYIFSAHYGRYPCAGAKYIDNKIISWDFFFFWIFLLIGMNDILLHSVFTIVDVYYRVIDDVRMKKRMCECEGDRE